MKNIHNFDVFVTVTGLNKYPDCRRLFEGETLVLMREPDNEFDKSAISVYGENGKIGYIANSSKTVREGTLSAAQLGSIMDSSQLKAEVVEGTYTDALCRVLDLFDVDKMTLKAFEYYNYGEYESALELFLKLGEKYSSVFLSQYTADCCIKLEKYEESLSFLESALTIDDSNKVSLMMYATALEGLGRYNDAAVKYLKILEETENIQVREALNNCLEKGKAEEK